MRPRQAGAKCALRSGWTVKRRAQSGLAPGNVGFVSSPRVAPTSPPLYKQLKNNLFPFSSVDLSSTARLSLRAAPQSFSPKDPWASTGQESCGSRRLRSTPSSHWDVDRRSWVRWSEWVPSGQKIQKRQALPRFSPLWGIRHRPPFQIISAWHLPPVPFPNPGTWVELEGRENARQLWKRKSPAARAALDTAFP